MKQRVATAGGVGEHVLCCVVAKQTREEGFTLVRLSESYILATTFKIMKEWTACFQSAVKRGRRGSGGRGRTGQQSGSAIGRELVSVVFVFIEKKPLFILGEGVPVRAFPMMSGVGEGRHC